MGGVTVHLFRSQHLIRCQPQCRRRRLQPGLTQGYQRSAVSPSAGDAGFSRS